MTEEKLQDMKRQFCKDCLEKEGCNSNPIECMKGEAADLYFDLYNTSAKTSLGRLME